MADERGVDLEGVASFEPGVAVDDGPGHLRGAVRQQEDQQRRGGGGFGRDQLHPGEGEQTRRGGPVPEAAGQRTAWPVGQQPERACQPPDGSEQQ
ncbi:hypothetical protein ACFQGX_03030 [Nonomuraea dietziae]|uniref:hypothetical protein n=1 Tax=Nonomuraea dietziae TaxID=65515 RepID=UPI00361365CE